MTTGDRRTRETVAAAFALTKSHSRHRWDEVRESHARRWSTLIPSSLDQDQPDELGEEMQDAFDAALAKEEARRHGTKSLTELKEELGLRD